MSSPTVQSWIHHHIVSIGYSGTDNLEVMEEAVNYNRTLLGFVTQYLAPGQRILDFGAGIGTFAGWIANQRYAVECVEPDVRQRKVIAERGLKTFANLAEVPDANADLIYTLNVLEHIDDDRGTIELLRRKLRIGGTLIIYVPAFPALYSSMDAKVGHVRRYTLNDLRHKVVSCDLTLVRAEYVDSLGFFVSLVYQAIGSKTGEINRKALHAYDRYLFRLSRFADRGLKRFFGKNLLLVGRRDN
jgi:2-polyprenyl-3-methyl-5-hydroxy-6-metoxy-1,4-benzoquinol methylase